jgi:2-deoxy-D-gluconate 3-dehydrogenase
MRALADPGANAVIATRIPMKRMGEPYELMGAAVFLASQGSSYVTGHVLVVDGGYSIMS